MNDQLGNHAVVEGRDKVAGVQGRIDPNPQTARRVISGDPSRRRQERCRILCRDTALDRMTAESDIFLCVAETVSSRDADLLTNQIDSAYHFGNRMLDLLDDLRHGLLRGAVPVSKLEGLLSLVRNQRDRIDDPRLAEVLDEIEVRAAVELAKLERMP